MKRVEIPLKLLLSKEAIEDAGIMYICYETGLRNQIYDLSGNKDLPELYQAILRRDSR